ncbi:MULTISPECIES: S24 family peptidase [unclassified Neisseria]|uniref:S24 family peptidase n=1 Tax=unclassified Neisseria TaxID=2623750 RepID=UPI0010723F0E|nr:MULTISPECIES: S24 family peptidase [unclassified Neisseria]MBF0803311.1 S24 family peptidase [Neisseria sp. 19428wB4_WF04]TFU43983.1 S24 family peptidase [Neisseria sp. WF04]
MNAKFSVSEIENLVSTFNLRSLPNTGRAIQYRAQNENWPFDEVPSQGGKKGIKRIYPLPRYVIDELEEKDLLHLIEDSNNTPQGGIVPSESYIYSQSTPKPAARIKETPASYSVDSIPVGMDNLIKNYKAWASSQDTENIVPVRYHVNVYGSAGNGVIAWDEEETEAMWFRASFFNHLGVNPNRCFCTRVKGDSMFPTLIDLGTALWYATAKYTEEGIYLFRQYDEIRIKRLQRLNAHTFNIISDNANKVIYPNTELDLSQAEPHDFEILGRYLWSCGIAK